MMSGLVVDADLCVGCRRCERACAFGGIVVRERVARPTDACTLCGSCVDACPVDAIHIDRGTAAPADDMETSQGIWVIVQRDAAGVVLPVSFELIAKARELAAVRGESISAVLAEPADGATQAEALIRAGADEVIRCRNERFAEVDAEASAQLIVQLVRERHPEVVLFGATAFGRELAPRVAVLLQTGLTADCTMLSIDAESVLLQQTRPAFGGNLMATIECPAHRPQMATVRPGVFAIPDAPAGADDAASVSAESVVDVELGSCPPRRVHVRGVEAQEGGSIAGAHRLVVVGRGIGSKKNLPLMARLAELLGAELGCTRPLVESGWLEYPHQVGQTGAAVAPELLVSIGVSGAIQHLAGIAGAKTIIAINEDPGAPIFASATYQVVGDCLEIVPALIAELEARVQ